MRSSLFMASVASLLLISTACKDGETVDDSGADAASFDLDLTGSGFTPHAGNTITAAVVDASGAVVDTQSGVMGDDGELSIHFAEVLVEGERYRVDWYADFNDNGLCDAVPTDHQWSVEIDAVSEDVLVSYDHDTNFSEVCDTFGGAGGAFDLELSGSGFTPHSGNTVTAAVVRADGKVVDTQSGVMGDDGELSMLFVGALAEGVAYHVDWYADFNDSGTCDPAPTDHQWSVDVPAVSEDVLVSYDHDTNFAEVCDTF